MAKLTADQWEKAKLDYEVHGLSYSDLIKKYGMSKGALSNRANGKTGDKVKWEQGKSEHLINKKVNAIKELRDYQVESEQLEPVVQLSLEHEIQQRLANDKMFQDSALLNQSIANNNLANAIALEETTDGEMRPMLGHNGQPLYRLEMKDLKAHADLTAKNKETVLGKQPETAIQINNNNGGSVIDALVKKRLSDD